MKAVSGTLNLTLVCKVCTQWLLFISLSTNKGGKYGTLYGSGIIHVRFMGSPDQESSEQD